MQLQAGTLLQGGKYKIERVLGQGGFGITYLATQELLDRRVCIKEFFFKEYCERDEVTSHVSLGTQSNHEIVERFMNKFLKEARTISQLDHPNIIHIHDIFKENGTAYYVMDFIEGESLSDKVNHNGALSESEAVDYIKQVASALDFIHQRSINHLDVKPANIMVRRSDNRAILIDFGLSKQYDEQGGQTSTTPVGISHGYAPMEQYNAGGVSSFSPQTDIYALGATCYKLVTGTTPPQAIEVFNDGLTGIPQSLSPNLVEAIRKTMQPKRADRPQSISEFMVLLDGEYATNAASAKSQSEIDESTRVIGTSSSEPIKKPSSSPQPTINKVEETKGKNGMIKFGVVIGIVVVCFITLYLSDIGNSDSNYQSYTTNAPQKPAQQQIQQPASNHEQQSTPSEKKALELKTIVDYFDSYINTNTRGWSLMSNFKDCNRTAGLEMETKYLPFGCKYQGVLLMDNKAVSNSFGEPIKWDFILEGARVGAEILILESYEPYNLDDYLKSRMKAKLISTETLTFAWLDLYSYKNSYILVHKYGGGSAGNDVEIHLGGDKSRMDAIATNIRNENTKFWQ